MKNGTSTETEFFVIDTTVGELISAIRDAALEASVKEEDLSEVTQMVLLDMCNRADDSDGTIEFLNESNEDEQEQTEN